MGSIWLRRADCMGWAVGLSRHKSPKRSLVADNQCRALQFDDLHFPKLGKYASYRFPAGAYQLRNVFMGQSELGTDYSTGDLSLR